MTNHTGASNGSVSRREIRRLFSTGIFDLPVLNQLLAEAAVKDAIS